jgi:hypothetical protein
VTPYINSTCASYLYFQLEEGQELRQTNPQVQYYYGICKVYAIMLETKHTKHGSSLADAQEALEYYQRVTNRSFIRISRSLAILIMGTLSRRLTLIRAMARYGIRSVTLICDFVDSPKLFARSERCALKKNVSPPDHFMREV